MLKRLVFAFIVTGALLLPTTQASAYRVRYVGPAPYYVQPVASGYYAYGPRRVYVQPYYRPRAYVTPYAYPAYPAYPMVQQYGVYQQPAYVY